MLHDIVVALWFFLPAGLANMAPIFAAHTPLLSRLDAPMDGGKKLRGVRMLGENKTWRGLIAGTITGALVAFIQATAFGVWPEFADYIGLPTMTTGTTLLVGALLGFGALMGDAVESFFKRQLRIAPGKSWVPFDQTDFIIGATLCTLPLMQLSLGVYIWALILLCLLHFFSSFVGWKIGMKKSPI